MENEFNIMKNNEVKRQCLGCGVDFVSHKYSNRKFHNQECYLKNGFVPPNLGKGKFVDRNILYQKYAIEKKQHTEIIKDLGMR